jgi:hypothetical protein
MDLDGIPMTMLKAVAMQFENTLSHIFRLSITQGYFLITLKARPRPLIHIQFITWSVSVASIMFVVSITATPAVW